MSTVSVQSRVLRVLRVVVIVALVAATVLPFVYMLSLSFVRIDDLLRDPLRVLPQLDRITTETYRAVLASEEDGGYGFGRFMRNSAVVAVAASALTVALVVPASYALTRLRFAGRSQVSWLFLAVYLFPTIIIAVPVSWASRCWGSGRRWSGW